MRQSPTPLARIQQQLERLRATQLYRERAQVTGPQGVEIDVQGERLLAFCSNDYLGLANHPKVVAALQAGAAHYGVGAGASHLVVGHTYAHHALEEELAEFLGAPRALLFSTGYMANLGIAAGLLDRRATVFEDKLNHASLIDAARASQARVQRYPHGDLARLGRALAASRGEKLILTDGVFSMDGDLAPLPRLIPMAAQHSAFLLVDEAHALGVLGAQGRGSFEHFGLPADPMVLRMGTLGKALGTFGAFVAGDDSLIEYLIQRARTYIYTTALPAAVAEAARASLRVIQDEPWRRAQLHERIDQFRRGAAQLELRLLPSETPIQPLILGTPAAALAASQRLRARGILVSAIRPPTVPPGSARLRITLSAAHSAQQVERLLQALADTQGLA